jgi:MFS family permease
MLTTMRVSVLHALPMTDAQFALLMTAFLWPYALMGPFGGLVADKFSRKWVVVASLGAWSTITLITAHVDSWGEFMVMRGLLGIAQSCYVPAAVAMVVDFHRARTQGLASGIHLTGMVLGSAIGSIGGWIAERHGWTFAYTAVALPSLAWAVVLLFFLKDPPREDHGPSKSIHSIRLGPALKSLLQSVPFCWFLVAMIIQGAVSWIIIGWMPTVMREQFHLGQGIAGFSTLGFVYFFQLTGLLTGGVWSDRKSANNPRFRITLPAIAIFVATPVFFLTGWIPHMSITFIGLGMWGYAMGLFGANQMPITCLIVDPRYRATATGLSNGVTAIAGGIAVYVVGALRDAGMGVTLIMTCTGVGVLLVGYALWLVNTTLRRAQAAATS